MITANKLVVLFVMLVVVIVFMLPINTLKLSNSGIQRSIEEVMLSDGTKCAVYKYYGITCKWER